MLASLTQAILGLVQIVVAGYGLSPQRVAWLYGLSYRADERDDRDIVRRRLKLLALRIGLMLAGALLSSDGIDELFDVEDDD